jgi:hypothetical protein
MNQAEVNATYESLSIAKNSKDVQYWLTTLKKLADDLIIQEYNASGENAVRALGVQKGIGMALMLDEIYKSNVKSSLVVPNKTILKP